MATQNWGVDKTFKASVDMNLQQYHFVKSGSIAGEVTLQTGIGGSALGVLQNDPRAGEEATVRVMGVTKVMGTATCSAASPLIYGGLVKSYNDGGAAGIVNSTTASLFALGIALEPLTTGCAVVSMLLFPMGLRY